MSLMFDLEAEKALLSCCFLDKNALTKALSSLSPDDFFNDFNKNIFKSFIELTDEGKSIDIVTVNNALNSFGITECLNDLSAIFFFCSNAVNVDDYISIVIDKSFLRKTHTLAKKILEFSEKGRTEDVLTELSKISKNSISDKKYLSFSEITDAALSDLDERIKNGTKFTGLKTGFLDFDLMTGGLQNGDLIILAARPSMGKTAFLLDIIRNTAFELLEKNKVSVFFSLEMSNSQLAFRVLSAESSVKLEKFRFGNLSESDFNSLEKISKNFDKKSGNIFVCEDMNLKLSDINNILHRIRAETGKDIGLISVDYLQLLSTKGDNRAFELSVISRGFKKIAKEFNCPFIALSQLSRNCENRPDKRPILADIKESGAIEQDADIVCFLYRDEYYFKNSEDRGTAELRIAKNRNGSVGTLKFLFLPEYTTFKNLVRE